MKNINQNVHQRLISRFQVTAGEEFKARVNVVTPVRKKREAIRSKLSQIKQQQSAM